MEGTSPSGRGRGAGAPGGKEEGKEKELGVTRKGGGGQEKESSMIKLAKNLSRSILDSAFRSF